MKMLRKIIFTNSLINNQGLLRHFSAKASTAVKEKYDIHAGVLIERLPVISKNFNELENEVMALFKKIEFENSLKSDHELKKEKDERQAIKLKAGVETKKTDSRQLQTAQDFEDMGQEELSKFKFAPRVTEDDKNNNIKSLNRKLDDTLFLVCDHKLGNDNVMLLPQGKWIEGESLRQTAERIVKEKFGSDVIVHFYGNAPIGFYRYKYPQAERKETVGAKIFFFRAIYKSGNVVDKKSPNYMWINEDELKTKVKDTYFNAVKSFLCT